MKRRRIVTLVIGLMAAVAAVAAVPVSASLAAASSPISSGLGNRCLQPVNGSTVQGAAIVQQPCNGGAAQEWTNVPVSGNIFHYKNVLSGLCLDARGGATNGTPVQQWTCNSISNENWEPGEYSDDESPFRPLISRVSGTSSHCLDVPGGHDLAGLAMQIARCNGTGAQQWWIP